MFRGRKVIWETGDRAKFGPSPNGRWEKGSNFVGDLWEMGDGSIVIGDGRSVHIPLGRWEINSYPTWEMEDKAKKDGKWNMVPIVCKNTDSTLLHSIVQCRFIITTPSYSFHHTHTYLYFILISLLGTSQI